MSSLPRPVAELLHARLGSNNLSPAGEPASLALCLLYHARSLPDKDDVRQRLINQSYAYYQKAVDSLCYEQHYSVPLDAKLIAIYDLFTHQLEAHGAAAGHAVTMIADLFVCEAHGPRPVIDLSAINTASDWLLVAHA